MYCSQCAHELSELDVYCPKCAKPVASFNFNPHAISQVEYVGEVETVVRTKEPPAEKRPPSSWYAIGLAGFVISFALLIGTVTLFGIYYLALSEQNSQSGNRISSANLQQKPVLATDSENQRSQELPTQTPTPLPQPRIQLVNSSFGVEPQSYYALNFYTVEPARITGGFRIYGGSNDIDFLIVDQDNYQLLASGRPFRSFDRRNRVDRGKIDITVPAGTTFVVFSNQHSLLTPKTVAAEIYYEFP